MTVSPGKVQAIYPGDSRLLKAKVSPTGCSNKDVDWTSSNDSIVTVGDDGTITALRPGNATIKATTREAGSDKKHRAVNCKVTVKPRPAKKLAVAPATVKLSANGTQQLSFTVEPANVTQIVPIYKSSNSKVAFVSESGLITGLKKGGAVISVTVGGKTAKCKVSVTTDPPAGIDLGYSGITLFTGEESALTCEVYTLGSGNAKVFANVDQNVTLRSSNPQVARITGGNTIVATGAGVCEIAARSDVGSFEEYCVVTVHDRKPVMKDDKASLAPGGSKDLKAALAEMAKDGVAREWMWGSSVPEVAEVTQDGIVTAKKPGKATIMAFTLWGDSVTFEVEVA